MTPLYLYRDAEQLPEPATADLASDADRNAYARRCARALEVAAQDDEAFVTTAAAWRAYLTLASMFRTDAPNAWLIPRMRSESATCVYVDHEMGIALAEAWGRAYDNGPLIPGLAAGSPRPVGPSTGDPAIDAEYQQVLDAVFEASEPRERDHLFRLAGFAADGPFLVDVDPAGHLAPAATQPAAAPG